MAAKPRTALGALHVERNQQSRIRPPSKVPDQLKLTAPLPAATVTTSEKFAPVAARPAPAMTTAPMAASKAVPTRTVTTRTAPAPAAKAPPAKGSPPARPVGRATTTATTTTATARTRTTTAPAPATTTAGQKRPAPSRTTTTTSSTATSSAAAQATKRARQWDVRGRLDNLEETMRSTASKVNSDESIKMALAGLEQSQRIVSEIDELKTLLQQTVQAKQTEQASMSLEVEELKRKMEILQRAHEDELHSVTKRLRMQMDDMQELYAALTNAKGKVEADLLLAQQENQSLRATIAHQSGALLEAESTARTLRLALEAAEATIKTRTEENARLEAAIADAHAQVLAMEAKLRADEAIRRKLHNTILELKGNIRVFCRIRPLLGNETSVLSSGPLSGPLRYDGDGMDERTIQIVQQTENAVGQAAQKIIPFTFDRVFSPEASQPAVFDEISQLVQSALDGYRVCIFAYGQTGSGKTYTMEGPPASIDNEEQRGMIPRAVHQIFASAKELEEKGWSYRMEASFIEIYNENLRDLLGNGEEKKHEIRHNDKLGVTTVTDVVIVELKSPDQAIALLRKASENRAVGRTQSNERSSRSHSVFMLRLYGSNPLTGEKCDGVLNLIDLAGSERLSQSGATGERLKETQAINKSLSSLADVIVALANKDAHVPYRNSKLTYLLQNSLGGNSKTLMFVNVSPLPAHSSETLCSLRFATKVNSCEIGTAKRVVKN